MNEQWLQWQNKINELNQRERIILLVTLLVAVVMLFQVVLIDPVLKDRKRSTLEIRKVEERLQQTRNAQSILSAQLAAGVNRHKLALREQLTSELAVLDEKIETSVIALIPPQMMPQVLEEVLAQNKELRLVSLENKPVAPVIEDAEPSSKNPARAATSDMDAAVNDKRGLYRHGFVLTLTGNYMAAIRYFEELTKLPWRFYWDDLHYQVESYPNAKITLEVHTVSMSEDWIGV